MRPKGSSTASGAIPSAVSAAVLSLLIACGPAFAANSDIICDRAGLSSAPAMVGDLKVTTVDVEIVNLGAPPEILDLYDVTDPRVARPASEQSIIRREMTAKERATTILREIFDEPAERPELSFAPTQEPIAEPADSGDPRNGIKPPTGFTDAESVPSDHPIDFTADPALDDRLPNQVNEGSMPYRDQMYRTDI